MRGVASDRICVGKIVPYPIVGNVRALYLTYDGLTDPLGQSQILPYLEGLSRDGNRFVVLSFEKPAAATPEAVASVEARCRRHGIVWRLLRYHKRPTLVATLYDVARGLVVGRRLCRQYRPACLHARSDIPALIGLLLKRVTGAPLVFDMRGFWAQERVDGGLWREGSLVARLARHLERRLMAAADRLVVLTEAMAEALRRRGVTTPITVIPTCVDTNVFRPTEVSDEQEGLAAPLGAPHRGAPALGRLASLPYTLQFASPSEANRRGPWPLRQSGRAARPSCSSFADGGGGHEPILVYAGSLGTVYMLEEMLRFAAEAFRLWGGGRLLLVSPQSREPFVAQAIARSGVSAAQVECVRAAHAEVPSWIARADAGIAFYKPSPSVIGRYPTKVGEYLACGVPVVVNADVPDATRLVTTHRVGTVVQRFDAVAFRRAAEQLQQLMAEGAVLRQRCRRVAEDHLAVSVGVTRYRQLYESLAPAVDSHVPRLTSHVSVLEEVPR